MLGCFVSDGAKLTAGKGRVFTDVTAKTGSTISILPNLQSDANIVRVEAEELQLGSNWDSFSLQAHAANGGSFSGEGVSKGAVQYVNDQDAGASFGDGSGIASGGIFIKRAGVYDLYAKVVAPSNSGLPVGNGSVDDPVVDSHFGNDSFYTSSRPTTLSIEADRTASSNGLPGIGGVPDVAQWTSLSAGGATGDGVVRPSDRTAPAYQLRRGYQQVAIGGREVGTIIDGLVLSDTALNAGELERALAGPIDSFAALEVRESSRCGRTQRWKCLSWL